MIVNSTDLKNNLGKYLRQPVKEEIIITSNGRRVAKLSPCEDFEKLTANNEQVKERALTFLPAWK